VILPNSTYSRPDRARELKILSSIKLIYNLLMINTNNP
jgi:hypothetical protein